MNVSHGIIWKPWPVVVRKAHLVLIRPAVLHIPFHLRPFPPGTLALSCGPLPPLASHSPPACVLPCFSLSRGVRGSLAGLGCPCLGKSPPTAEAGRRAGGVGWGGVGGAAKGGSGCCHLPGKSDLCCCCCCCWLQRQHEGHLRSQLQS